MGVQFSESSDSVRAGSANEGTETPSAPRPRALTIGIKPVLGISLATGDEYDDSDYIDKGSILSFGVGLEVEYLVAQDRCIVSGLNYIRKGRYYEEYQAVPVYGSDWLEVDEYVHYVKAWASTSRSPPAESDTTTTARTASAPPTSTT